MGFRSKEANKEMTNDFTPTQQAMLEVLADGLPHAREELHTCLPYKNGIITNIGPHLTAIRRQLRPIGHDIICEVVRRRPFYRHVRLITRDR